MIKRRISASFWRIVNVIQFVLLFVLPINFVQADPVNDIFVTPESALLCTYDVLGNADPVGFSAVWCQDCSAESLATTDNCAISVDNLGNCVYTATCKTGYGNMQNANTANLYCEPNAYNIIYMNGSDTVSGITPANYTYSENNQTITPSALSNVSGYTFAGWCTDPNDDSTCSNTQTIAGGTTGNITLYAKLVQDAYNITYILNGGTNYNGAPMVYVAGTGATINGTPTKSNATFGGWCRNADLTQCSNTQTISTTDTGDITFYAKWTCNTGYHGALDLQTIIGTVAGESFAYITGYDSFDEQSANYGQGFYSLSSGDTNAFGVNYGDKGIIHGHAACSTTTGNSVYATEAFIADETGESGAGNCWCRVDGYTPNGGSLQSVSSLWVYYGNYDTSLCASSCSSYCASLMQPTGASYLGFRTAVLGAVSDSASICEPDVYNITYMDGNNTVSGITPATYTYSASAQTITPTALSNTTGYTFAGWCTDPNDDTTCSNTQTIAGGATGGITLYAKWTEIVCTDTQYFDAGTNSCQACPQEYPHADANATSSNQCYREESCSAITCPAHATACSYVGATQWTVYPTTPNTEHCAIQVSTCDNGYAPNGNVCNPVNYTITLNTNGGSYSGNTTINYNVESNDITISAPTKTGYTFAGWSVTTAPTAWGNGSSSSGATNFVIATGTYGDITLTAQWTQVTCDDTQYFDAGTNSCHACPTEYPHADANATSSNQCYREESCPAITCPAHATACSYIGATQWTVYPTTPNTEHCAIQVNTCDNGYAPNGNVCNPVNYTITLNTNGGTYSGNTTINYNVESDDITIVAPSKAGYEFTGWLIETAPSAWGEDSSSNGAKNFVIATGTYGNIELSAQWISLTDTPYTVNHYVSDIEEGYLGVHELYMSETKAGTTGDTVAISDLVMNIPGFTFGAGYEGTATHGTTEPNSGVVTTTTILPNGNRVVDLYYYRNMYNVTLTKNGVSSVSASGQYSSGPYYYGDTITVSATVGNGFTWANWTRTEDGTVVSTSNPYTFTMGDSDVALTANATPNTYHVTLDSQSATTVYTSEFWFRYRDHTPCHYYTSNTEFDSSHCLGSNSYTITIPEKTGYTFGGYWTEVGGNGRQHIFVDGRINPDMLGVITNDITLYAYWIPRQFNVTYDCGSGATGTTPSATTATYDTGFTPAANTCINTGYTFGGWAVSNTNPSEIKTPGVEFNWQYVEDKTFTAQWTPNTYTVQFNLNGGTGSSETITATYDEVFDVTDPTREGYTFNGWNISGMDDTNHAFYSVREDNSYTISHDNSTSVNNVIYDWYANLRSTSGTVTFTAQWNTNTYTITYNLNNGTNDANNPDDYNVETPTITFADATRTGYTFGGWYTDSGFNTPITQITTGSTGDKTLYAKWTVIECTDMQYFDAGTNSCHACPTEYPHADANATSSNQCYREESCPAITCPVHATTCSYVGATQWTVYPTTPNTEHCAIQIDTCDSGYEKKNNTCTPIEYTIDYVLYDGTNAASNPSKYTIESSTITFADATRTGYTFGGWYTDSGFNTPITQIATGSTGNKTLYAKWTVIECTDTQYFDAGTNSCHSCPTEYPHADANATSSNQCYREESCPAITCPAHATSCSYIGATQWTVYPTTPNTEHCAIQIDTCDNGYEKKNNTCSPIEYTITYVLDNGTNAVGNPSTYTVETPTITFADATRTGYTFGGWYTDSGFVTPITQIATGSTGNKTLYAKWTAVKWTVTLDNMNATVPGTREIYVQQNIGTFRDTGLTERMTMNSNPITVPQKTGYTFGGYLYGSTTLTIEPTGYIEGYSESTFDDVVTGPTTLHAKWEPNTYTTQFVCGDGQGRPLTVSGKYEGDYGYSAPSVSSMCSRAGYIADGWNCTTNTNNTSVNDYIYEGANVRFLTPDDITCVAQWEKQTYKVIFKDIDENNQQIVLSRPAELSVTVDNMPFQIQNTDVSQFGYTENPFKTGYTFKNWCLDSDRTACYNSVQVRMPDSGNMAPEMYLWANWTPNIYSVQYKCDDNSEAEIVKTATFNKTYTPVSNTNYYGGGIDLCSKTGFSFTQWTCSNDSTEANVNMSSPFKWQINSDVTCVAQWSEKTFNVTFNANSENVSNPEAMNNALPNPCPYSTGCDIPANRYTYNGYNFVGWNTQSNGNGVSYPVVNGVIKEQDRDVTLYAQWTPALTICQPGTYLAAGQYGSCTPCEKSYYCPGTPEGEEGWPYNPSDPQGKYSCVDLMINDDATTLTTRSTSENDCLLPCSPYMNGKTGYNLLSRDGTFGYYKYNERPADVCRYSAQIQYVGVDEGLCVNTDYSLPADASLYLCFIARDATPGKTFLGWVSNTGAAYSYSSLSNSINAYNLSPVNGIVTMTAKWENHKYDVYYDCGEASSKVETVRQIPFESTYTLISSNFCNATGYTFVRWSCDVNYTDNSFTMPASDVHCSAVWDVNKYDILFDGNGANPGTSTESMLGINYNETVQLSENGFIRTGYDFAGWCKDWNAETETCDSSLYSNRQSVSALTNSGTVTLYAVWNKHKYNITYTMPDGFSNPNPSYYYIDTDTFSLEPATKKGYSFEKWCTHESLIDSACSVSPSIAKGSHEDLHFYIKYTTDNYDVYYKNIDGSDVAFNSEVKRQFTVNESFEFPTNVDNPGYTFNGWYKDTRFTQRTYGVNTGTAASLTVYAKWTAGNSKITYYCDENNTYEQTGKVGSVVQVISGEECDRPYEEVTWTCNGQTYAPSSNITILATDTICNATWTPEGTNPIIYKNITSEELPSGTATSYKTSVGYTFPTTGINREGYTFVGWYKDERLAQRTYGIGTGTTGVVYAYAKWKTQKYDVEYTCPDGTVITLNADYNSVLNVEDLITRCSETPGKEPEGVIYCDNNESYDNEIVVPAADLSCIVTWSYNNYNIFYKYIDETNTEHDLALSPNKYNVDTETFALPTPDIYGRNFVSWCNYANLTACAANKQVYKGSTGDITVYAKTKVKTIDCDSGEYLPQDAVECQPCENANEYCEGGEYPYNPNEPQGVQTCPAEYPFADAGAESEDDCYTECPKREHYTVSGRMYKNRNECVYDIVPGCLENYYMSSNEECIPCPEGLYSEGGYATTCGCPDGYSLGITTASELYPANSLRIQSASVIDSSSWKINIDPQTWMHNEALGSASCRNKSASTGSVWDESNDASVTGSYCWCQMTVPYETKWIYSGYQNGSGCSTRCSEICAERTRTNPSVRNALFTSAYTDGFADTTTETCVPNAYTITLDDNGGNNGSEYLYELYNTGFYADSEHTSSVSTVEVPVREGYEFLGYYGMLDSETMFIDSDGVLLDIMVPTFTEDMTLYAKWISNTVVCQEGKYVAAGSRSCDEVCEAGNYCPGGEYNYSEDEAQGKETCPTEYPESVSGSTSIDDCFKPCPEKQMATETTGVVYHDGSDTCEYQYECVSGKWLHIGDDDKICLESDKFTSPALVFDIGGTKYYLGLTEDTELPINKDSTKKMHVEYNGKSYNAHDVTVM